MAMDSYNKFDKIIKRIEIISLALVIACSIAGGAIFGFVTAEIKNYSGIHNLKSFQPNIPTRLYDINGELIAELFQEKRDLVSYEQLPSCLINSFIAAEDRDFFYHFGIDPPAIARAMVKNVLASGKARKITIVQGGSTITQQLAKRLFTASERTLARKILEAVLALQIEKKFSKEEILEMYFNQIYLGHGCHGIATASNFFFNKEVRQLSVIESSVLAALPSKPDGFSPIKNPREAFNKNKDTLNRMAEAGFIRRDNLNKLLEDFLIQ
jgi:penicillin-binding protein 1A